MQTKRIKVFGKVQGVYFRASTMEKAKMLGLSGWCKNKEDGSVEIVAEGKPELMQQLIDWCHHGPESAEVNNVLVEEIESGGFDAFEIRRS